MSWIHHAKGCFRCKRVVLDKPATLAYVCIAGLPLLKDILGKTGAAAAAEKKRAENAIYKYQMGEHGAQRITKDELKRLMRYK